MDWKLLLEFLKVLLTWSVIGGALMLTALLLFKKNIRSLIDRTAHIKFPGGEVSTSQQENLELATEAEKAPAVQPRAEPPKIEEGMHLTPQQVQELQQYMQAQDAAARIWEYRYLNFFLAPRTQLVLDWLVGLGTTTLPAMEAYWMPLVPDASERKAVIDALQRHWLITIQSQAITVTNKAREYAAWHERARHFQR